MEGFITKRGGFVKSWKRRWLTLKDGTLRYYRHCSSVSPPPAQKNTTRQTLTARTTQT